jgi:hypothetical protein
MNDFLLRSVAKINKCSDYNYWNYCNFFLPER